MDLQPTIGWGLGSPSGAHVGAQILHKPARPGEGEGEVNEGVRVEVNREVPSEVEGRLGELADSERSGPERASSPLGMRGKGLSVVDESEALLIKS